MKVLIAAEESECSRRAVQAVLERQWPEDSQFRVINVCESFPVLGAKIRPTYVMAENEMLRQKKSQVRMDIVELRKVYPVNLVSGDVLKGDPCACILEEARDWGADLIILGTHGREGISRAFLGSVAEGVAGSAGCSVEVVKAKRTH